MTQLKEKTLKIIAEAEKVIAEYDMALTVRQIYYRLVAKLIIPNDKQSYKRLCYVLKIAREQKLISFSSIVDRTRQPIKPTSWENPRRFFDTVKRAYRKSLLSDQDNYVEVWTEKDALSGVIAPITEKYDMYLQVARGYPSLSSLYETSLRMVKDNNKILYFGDFDPSGEDIVRDIETRLNNIFFLSVDVEIVRRGQVNRAKLYYLRDRHERAARLKERREVIVKDTVVAETEEEATAPEGEAVTSEPEVAEEPEAQTDEESEADTAEESRDEDAESSEVSEESSEDTDA